MRTAVARRAPRLEIAQWDSQFFGFMVGRLRGSRLTERQVARLFRDCLKHHVRCLYFEADAGDFGTIQVAQQHGFQLVDVRLTFRRSTQTPIPRVDGGWDLGVAHASDVPALLGVAESLHRVSRYYFDPMFRRFSRQLYRLWVENSFQGLADHVVVARSRGRAVGLVTCRVDGAVGRIVLMGVRPSHTGRNIGPSMMAQALRWFRRAGVKEVEVVTQARNVRALRAYAKAGFRPVSSHFFYHRWFDC